jgi:hypothetical protein
MEQTKKYRRIQVPTQDGGTLVEPAWSSLPQVVTDNRAAIQQADLEIQGVSLAELAAGARRDLLASAASYTAGYHRLPSKFASVSVQELPTLIFAGHQPQLFHPGVWYKNFAVAKLSHLINGIAVNLTIDSDLCRIVSTRVPTGSYDRPQIASVAYDHPTLPLPYEERAVCDEGTFSSFANRVLDRVGDLIPNPMVESFWPIVLARYQQEPNLGRALAQARHQLEGQFGDANGVVESLEIPQSMVCQLPIFHQFVTHLLVGLPHFVEIYNRALQEYRKTYRLRNSAHPVPNLSEGGGWMETPFWIWSKSNPRRRPLFARPGTRKILIGDQAKEEHELLLGPNGEFTSAVEQLQQLADRGIKIRTRAITTTLFARLFLADLFVHGIGGSKYDEVTDHILHGFYNINPPQYATISATRYLPIEHPSVTPDRTRQLQQELREMTFHPERFLDLQHQEPDRMSTLASILAEKSKWIKTPKTPANAAQRHRAIVGVNRDLKPFLAGKREALTDQYNRLAQQVQASSVLDSREYMFCLFPKWSLQNFLLDFGKADSS